MLYFFVASIEQSPVNGPLFLVGLRPNPSALRNKLRECTLKGSDFMYIKLYLSELEKHQLEEIALKRGMPVSKLCYDQVAPLLRNPFSLLENPADTNTDNALNYTNYVKVYFTVAEYQELVVKANGIPLSRYVRNMYLSRREPVAISVYTDDISILTMKVSGYIEQLHNFIAALAIRRQLYEADYERLIQIANDTKTALRDAANYAKANRSSIRASGVRILRKEIKKAVEREISTITGKDVVQE